MKKVPFLQKLYKKACLKLKNYAHTNRHTCSHTYMRVKESYQIHSWESKGKAGKRRYGDLIS